jgi:hypothetical protein
MKRLALIAAVVFTTFTLNSCRQADEVLSPDEMATLQKVRDTSKVTGQATESNTLNTSTEASALLELEGEIAAPPKK